MGFDRDRTLLNHVFDDSLVVQGFAMSTWSTRLTVVAVFSSTCSKKWSMNSVVVRPMSNP